MSRPKKKTNRRFSMSSNHPIISVLYPKGRSRSNAPSCVSLLLTPGRVKFVDNSGLDRTKPLVKTADGIPRPFRVNLDPAVRIGRVGLPGEPTVQRAVGVRGGRGGLGQVRQQLARRYPTFVCFDAIVRASSRGV